MISTRRLFIRGWREEEAEDFFSLTQDEGFTLYPINNYRQESIASARSWIERAIELNRQTQLGKWGVFEKVSGHLLGMGGLTPWRWEGEELVDITYRLRTPAWGQGYGLELARALVNYAFQVRLLPEITATITPDNLASKKIADKLGMKFERRIVLLNVPTDLYRLRGS
jgi:ribosomal-protein-alanine N-acetyltransferase